MLQSWLFALDCLLPLPAVGLGDFVEGFALHTSRKNLGCNMLKAYSRAALW